jgi:hypothetical protein
MPFRFNMLLTEVGLDPREVRLLRHQTGLPDGRTPFDLWQADLPTFEGYQSYQQAKQRASFARPWWASFVGTWDGRTLFTGLYSAGAPVLLTEDALFKPTGQTMVAGTVDRYSTALSDLLAPYRGRLYIDWGGGSSGKRAWSQRAEAHDKAITELHLEQAERPFPGYLELTTSLSHLNAIPPGWAERLAAAKGVYLLTCPRTNEAYVGSATGADGFLSRWLNYAATGHGGNVALVGREPSDFQVSILQVAGSGDSDDDIIGMEQLWKRKLGSRELGLNRN